MVVFLLFAMVQLFAINSLDLYSSGVTLQALGVQVKRYQAVLIDSVIACVVTIYAVFNSSFSTYLKDFVDLVIVWIAPWVAIYLVDWAMRRYALRAGRAADDRPRQPLLEPRRRPLAGHHRPAGGHGRLPVGALPHVLGPPPG